jgi:hypothetical protein
MSDLALPTQQAPRQIITAAERYAARVQDLAAARQAVTEAQAGVEAAGAEDRLLLAAALDEGRADPGQPNREKAERALAAAERRRDAEELRERAAHDALLQAIGTHASQWSTRLQEAWRKLDTEAAQALDKFEQVEARRGEARAAALWLGEALVAPAGHLEDALRRPVARYQQPFSRVPDARNANATLAVGALLEGLREHVAATSSTLYAEGADERGAVRARQDALAELRQNPETAGLAARVELTNELTLEAALDIAAGRRDLEDALAEHRAEAAARREGRLQGSLPPAWRRD